MTGQRTRRYESLLPALRPLQRRRPRQPSRPAPPNRNTTGPERSGWRARRRGPRHRRVETPRGEALRAPQRRWNPGCGPWALARTTGRRRAHRIAEARPRPTLSTHVDNPVDNPVDRLWTTCGKVLVPTSNPHVHTTLPTSPCGRISRTRSTKNRVIHISTGIYYLLPRYLSLGVIVPYGTRGRERSGHRTRHHGPSRRPATEKQGEQEGAADTHTRLWRTQHPPP